MTLINNLLIWGGVILVLGLLVVRWHMGVWDIEADDAPPTPTGWSLLLLVLGVLLVITGAYRMVMEL